MFQRALSGSGGGGSQVETGKCSINYSSYTSVNTSIVPKYVCGLTTHSSLGLICIEYVNGTCYLTYNYSGLQKRTNPGSNIITVSGNTISFKGDNSSWGTGTVYFFACSDDTPFVNFLTD